MIVVSMMFMMFMVVMVLLVVNWNLNFVRFV